MFIKAPFLLTDSFLTRYGYRGSRRFVGVYWVRYDDDGERSGCGMTDNWLLRSFVSRAEVAAWLEANQICLGDSERDAMHWLMVDGQTGELSAAPWREVRSALVRREVPG